MRRALEIEPKDRQCRTLLAGLLIDSDRNLDAVPILDELLEEYPDDVETKLKLGIALANMLRFKDALPVLQFVHEKAPENSNALLKLAFVYQRLEMFDEAIAHYEKLKVQEPREARSWSNLCAVYTELEEYDKAVTEGMDALRINPDVEQTYLNLAVVFQRAGHWDQAKELYRRALNVNPEYHSVGSNLSHLLLAQGEIEDGWDLYGHGFNAQMRRPQRFIDATLWQNEDISNDQIMVWKEQGIGDDMRFASCYPDLIARAGHVIIETDPRLVTLYQRSFPEATVRPEQTPKEDMVFVGPREFRYHTPAGQLPVHLRRSLDKFPQHEGYLKPDPERVAYWRQKVEAAGDGIRIGLSWRSMHRNVSRDMVYTELADWAELIAADGITCISLQYHEPDEEIAALERDTGLKVHLMEGVDLKDELDEAAALTKACDLVVSAGTSVADMSGALGVPVLFYGNYLHAMQLGTDGFPWYPSSVFFSRPPGSTMQPIVETITREVIGLARKHQAGELT